MEGAIRCSANHVPLTPISFLERSALVYADRPSIIDGPRRFTWSQTRRRCLLLASALSNLGISRGDVVAVLAQNIPAMYELHFGVPMAGAVLCTLNTRHDSAMISTLLLHSNARAIFVHRPLLETAMGALKLLSSSTQTPPLLVLIPDSDSDSSILNYESLLQGGDPNFTIRWPADECDPISLNYTSGTTSSPKGVLYSHRGAYLNSIATVLLWELPQLPVYLWTVPMFHCNGWCHAWGLAAQGGISVCLRQISGEAIFRSIEAHGVTHLAGAPTVLAIIANSTAAPPSLRWTVNILTGGAPPPPAVLYRIENMGFRVVHSYGMTETYGAATICLWKPEWDSLPAADRAKFKARQGVQHLGLEEVDVKNSVTMESVPADGSTVGEVMFRGNTVMSGYLKDQAATAAAFGGGWLRSGDLAVKHKDGYIELKDRAKDIIISGGENISSIEVEAVLFQHPAVADAAVVARPDEFWGETPCAFVQLKEGLEGHVGEKEIIAFCKARLPHYMAPKTVVFGELPKTSTGKTKKFLLRERAKTLGEAPSLTRSKL